MILTRFVISLWQKSFQKLLHKQDGTRAEWEYPFAVAGINISFMLAQMLDLQSGKNAQDRNQLKTDQSFISFCLLTSETVECVCVTYSGKPSTIAGIRFLAFLEDDEMAFDNLYCIAFQMMDAQWLAKRASYMEFNVKCLLNQAWNSWFGYEFSFSVIC